MIKGNKIKMMWMKSQGKIEFNFGDDLGPYIVKKLTGLEPDYIKNAGPFPVIVKQLIKDILKSGNIFSNVKLFLNSFFLKEYLITVGSILEAYSSSKAVVWGSGIIVSHSNLPKAKSYYAVRGKFTQRKIQQFLGDQNIALGDPALLLPLIYKPKREKKFQLGIIPHYKHYHYLKQLKIPERIKVVNLLTPDVEQVVEDIFSCEYTISTSLHGLIVSHAYNIPSLWYTIQEIPLYGDNVKFLDYFSSVGIPAYQPFRLEESLVKDPVQIINTINKFRDVSLPVSDLSVIQKQLLECAPFPVKKEYLDIFNSQVK